MKPRVIRHIWEFEHEYLARACAGKVAIRIVCTVGYCAFRC